MPMRFRSIPGLKQKKAKQGDVSSLVRIDNPDDAEFSGPLGEGDDSSLIKVDNPDDADIYNPDNRRYTKPSTISGNVSQKQQKK